MSARRTDGPRPADMTQMHYQDEHTAAWETTVEALTTAVRLIEPTHGRPLDFADFLTTALAAVAANIGSTDRLTAGRPGSWEADHIMALVAGTVGHDDELLAYHRTEPVVVPLNVHLLMSADAVARTGCLETPCEIEIEAVSQRHQDLPEAEYDADAEDAEIHATCQRWAARYRAYADAFTAAVLGEAAQIEGLTVPVTVQAITDPDETETGPLHPDELDDPDPLVFRLWDTARRTVPLPTGTPDTPPPAGQ